MKKSELDKNIFGRRAAGYHVLQTEEFERRTVGVITALNARNFSVCIENGLGKFWFHCSAVRLLKKKHQTIYWAHKGNLQSSKLTSDYVPVKIINLKGEK